MENINIKKVLIREPLFIPHNEDQSNVLKNETENNSWSKRNDGAKLKKHINPLLPFQRNEPPIDTLRNGEIDTSNMERNMDSNMDKNIDKNININMNEKEHMNFLVNKKNLNYKMKNSKNSYGTILHVERKGEINTRYNIMDNMYDIHYMQQNKKNLNDYVKHVNVNQTAPCVGEFRTCMNCFINVSTLFCKTCNIFLCAVCNIKLHNNDKNHIINAASSGIFENNIPFNKKIFEEKNKWLVELTNNIPVKIKEKCALHSEEYVKFSCKTCDYMLLCSDCLLDDPIHVKHKNDDDEEEDENEEHDSNTNQMKEEIDENIYNGNDKFNNNNNNNNNNYNAVYNITTDINNINTKNNYINEDGNNTQSNEKSEKQNKMGNNTTKIKNSSNKTNTNTVQSIISIDNKMEGNTKISREISTEEILNLKPGFKLIRGNHEIFTLMDARHEVKNELNEMLDFLNEKSLVIKNALPALTNIYKFGKITYKNNKRNLKASFNKTTEILKKKKRKLHDHLKDLQNKSTDFLNHLDDERITYVNYLEMKRNEINSMIKLSDRNSGLAINKYVDKLESFRNLFFTSNNLIDIQKKLKIPHAQLKSKHLPLLVSDMKMKIYDSVKTINDISEEIKNQYQKFFNIDIDVPVYPTHFKRLLENLKNFNHATAENKKRENYFSIIPFTDIYMNMETTFESTFKRKDSLHTKWEYRTITVRSVYLCIHTHCEVINDTLKCEENHKKENIKKRPLIINKSLIQNKLLSKKTATKLSSPNSKDLQNKQMKYKWKDADQSWIEKEPFKGTGQNEEQRKGEKQTDIKKMQSVNTEDTGTAIGTGTSTATGTGTKKRDGEKQSNEVKTETEISEYKTDEFAIYEQTLIREKIKNDLVNDIESIICICNVQIKKFSENNITNITVLEKRKNPNGIEITEYNNKEELIGYWLLTHNSMDVIDKLYTLLKEIKDKNKKHSKIPSFHPKINMKASFLNYHQNNISTVYKHLAANMGDDDSLKKKKTKKKKKKKRKNKNKKAIETNEKMKKSYRNSKGTGISGIHSGYNESLQMGWEEMKRNWQEAEEEDEEEEEEEEEESDEDEENDEEEEESEEEESEEEKEEEESEEESEDKEETKQKYQKEQNQASMKSDLSELINNSDKSINRKELSNTLNIGQHRNNFQNMIHSMSISRSPEKELNPANSFTNLSASNIGSKSDIYKHYSDVVNDIDQNSSAPSSIVDTISQMKMAAALYSEKKNIEEKEKNSHTEKTESLQKEETTPMNSSSISSISKNISMANFEGDAYNLTSNFNKEEIIRFNQRMSQISNSNEDELSYPSNSNAHVDRSLDFDIKKPPKKNIVSEEKHEHALFSNTQSNSTNDDTELKNQMIKMESQSLFKREVLSSGSNSFLDTFETENVMEKGSFNFKGNINYTQTKLVEMQLKNESSFCEHSENINKENCRNNIKTAINYMGQNLNNDKEGECNQKQVEVERKNENMELNNKHIYLSNTTYKQRDNEKCVEEKKEQSCDLNFVKRKKLPSRKCSSNFSDNIKSEQNKYIYTSFPTTEKKQNENNTTDKLQLSEMDTFLQKLKEPEKAVDDVNEDISEINDFLNNMKGGQTNIKEQMFEQKDQHCYKWETNNKFMTNQNSCKNTPHETGKHSRNNTMKSDHNSDIMESQINQCSNVLNILNILSNVNNIKDLIKFNDNTDLNAILNFNTSVKNTNSPNYANHSNKDTMDINTNINDRNETMEVLPKETRDQVVFTPVTEDTTVNKNTNNTNTNTNTINTNTNTINTNTNIINANTNSLFSINTNTNIIKSNDIHNENHINTDVEKNATNKSTVQKNITNNRNDKNRTNVSSEVPVNCEATASNQVDMFTHVTKVHENNELMGSVSKVNSMMTNNLSKLKNGPIPIMGVNIQPSHVKTCTPNIQRDKIRYKLGILQDDKSPPIKRKNKKQMQIGMDLYGAETEALVETEMKLETDVSQNMINKMLSQIGNKRIGS